MMASRRLLLGSWLAAAVLFTTAAALADTASQNAKVRALFTPGDDIGAAIVQSIRVATNQIWVQAYSFTHKSIARALQEAVRRGVVVSVLADREQFERGASFLLRDLRLAGADVRLDGEHGAAHNKIIVIDAETNHAMVITGSFNFTQAAQKHNAENIIIIDNDTALASAYAANWRRHWKHAAALE